jgi:chitinase
MKNHFFKTIFTLLFLNFCITDIEAQIGNKHIINGYVGGYRGKPIDVNAIKANMLTHINYAFVNCIDSMAVLSNLKTDTINFRLLNQLKNVNPNLKIVISIGGWTWSKNFSDAVLTSSSRALFAKTSVDIIKQYNLDGIDIDWEYPGQKGDNNRFRPEDKQNYTRMFVEMRKQLNELEKHTGKKYLLTTAVGGDKSFINNSEMDQVAKILDYIYLMTYDYLGPKGTVGHHTNLYSNSAHKYASSAHQTVKDFIQAGVPAEKLVLGIAFYGKEVIASNGANNGLGQPILLPKPTERGIFSKLGSGFTSIKENFINNNGYSYFWDDDAKAPYLFNSETNSFITYDDEQSTKLKSIYAKENNLAGVFFWEYFNDPAHYLLNVINTELR